MLIREIKKKNHLVILQKDFPDFLPQENHLVDLAL